MHLQKWQNGCDKMPSNDQKLIILENANVQLEEEQYLKNAKGIGSGTIKIKSNDNGQRIFQLVGARNMIALITKLEHPRKYQLT